MNQSDLAERERLCRELNAVYHGEWLNITPEEIELTDEGWTIDGMDPWEWCEAMLMD